MMNVALKRGEGWTYLVTCQLKEDVRARTLERTTKESEKGFLGKTYESLRQITKLFLVSFSNDPIELGITF